MVDQPASESRTLTDIYHYPVKSLRGRRIASYDVEPRGMVGDRRWMLVDDNGAFITQRHAPKLARVAVELDNEGITLSLEGGPSVHVRIPDSEGPRRRCRVWNDHLDLLDAGDAAAQAVADLLGRPCRIVYQDDQAVRPVDPRFRVSETDNVSLADGYPILLTTTASLDDLNARLASPISMDRFRPNLVVANGRPFEEDTWKRIRIGEVTFAVVKPCARCAVTTIDQVRGERSAEPLRTLATYRTKRGRILFGQNLIPVDTGTLGEGMPLDVLE